MKQLVASTRSNVLWTVLFHTGDLLALRMVFDERPCLPLFSNPYKAEVWILGMNLEQHRLSAPLWPLILKQLLEHAESIGFEFICLDPSADKAIPFQATPMENMLEQVEAKI